MLEALIDPRKHGRHSTAADAIKFLQTLPPDYTVVRLGVQADPVLMGCERISNVTPRGHFDAKTITLTLEQRR